MTLSTKRFTILPPTQETLPSFSRLTRTLLPINYPPKFFEASLHPPSPANAYSLARIAIWNDVPDSNTAGQIVAGIYGRIQPKLHPEGVAESQHGNSLECQLYIATLAVLAPWRGKGIAAALLRDLVAATVGFVDVRMDPDLQIEVGLSVEPWMLGPLTTVCAHVWEVNDSGLGWYRSQGFEAGEILRGYYRKLRPDGARLVKRGVVGLLVDGGSDKGEFTDGDWSLKQ